jgi:hypothetical protein
MAGGANFYVEILTSRGTGGKTVTAAANNRNFAVFGVNILLHIFTLRDIIFVLIPLNFKILPGQLSRYKP